jgi:hypothetical protein
MDGSRGCDDKTDVVGKPAKEVVSGAGEGEWDGTEEEPTDAQLARAGGNSVDSVDGGGVSVATDGMLAQPLFLKPGGLGSVEGATGARAAALDVAFAILTPAAAAILRSSFSSRFLSFSLRLSCSSGVFCLARWVFCMSRKRILWWCAYEFVCSSYWATFWNCLSQTVQ